MLLWRSFDFGSGENCVTFGMLPNGLADFYGVFAEKLLNGFGLAGKVPAGEPNLLLFNIIGPIFYSSASCRGMLKLAGLLRFGD